MTNRVSPQFRAGDRVVSLAYHPPEIESGTEATVVSPHLGALYAVQLPDGELHRWFTGFELQSVNPNANHFFQIGALVKIQTTHGHPPKIEKGMVVKVVKVIPQIYFYDLMLDDDKYHRWLAEFEITYPV